MKRPAAPFVKDAKRRRCAREPRPVASVPTSSSSLSRQASLFLPPSPAEAEAGSDYAAMSSVIGTSRHNDGSHVAPSTPPSPPSPRGPPGSDAGCSLLQQQPVQHNRRHAERAQKRGHQRDQSPLSDLARRAASKRTRVSDADRIWLNVAGTPLQTTSHTLRALGPCYLTRHLDTLLPAPDEIFLDTSPRAFDVLHSALLVAQVSIVAAIRLLHERQAQHGDTLRCLLDFAMLGWTLGTPLLLHSALLACTALPTSGFLRPGAFLEQEYISIESGLRDYGVTGGIFEYLRGRRLNPSRYETHPCSGEMYTRGTVHVSLECNTRESARHGPVHMGNHRRVALLSPLYNDGDQDGSSLRESLEEACFIGDYGLGEESVVSRIIFDLGRRFIVRLQAAIIGLTSSTGEPRTVTVRLDVVDGHAELNERPRLGPLAGDLAAEAELLPNYGVDEAGEFHYRHSLVRLTVPPGSRPPIGRLLSLEVWGRDHGGDGGVRWRLSAIEVFGDLVELPSELAMRDQRPPFVFDRMSLACVRLRAENMRPPAGRSGGLPGIAGTA